LTLLSVQVRQVIKPPAAVTKLQTTSQKVSDPDQSQRFVLALCLTRSSA